jgi:hypothetical protein
MNKKTLIIIVLIIIALGGIVWQIKSHSGDNDSSKQAEEGPKQLPSINGSLVDAAIAKRRPIAVMVENHIDSRPQSGLSEADVVYETLAEGGITRHMALYQAGEPKQIGPIRSVRNYFNFLANQWAAVIVHSGGSKDALQELRSNKYPAVADGDEYFNGKYFKRDNQKYAPHNLFSSTEMLRQMLTDKKWEDWNSGNYWNFAEVPADQIKAEATNISIPFVIKSYAVRYKFDPATNNYKRFVADQPVIDAGNKQPVSPKNILVQFADSFAVEAATEGGIDFNLDTSGPLTLFTAGKVIAGSWSYKNGKISYLDEQGQPLVLQPGPTWIEIVPKTLKSQVTWQ